LKEEKNMVCMVVKIFVHNTYTLPLQTNLHPYYVTLFISWSDPDPTRIEESDPVLEFIFPENPQHLLCKNFLSKKGQIPYESGTNISNMTPG
jgi:hypothetical protein